MDKAKIRYLQHTLLEWFALNGRKYFWRKSDVSNYDVIIAEILLQRTRADTVAKYFPSGERRKEMAINGICSRTPFPPFGILNRRFLFSKM